MSLFRIPAIVTHRGRAVEELSRRRQAAFLAAIYVKNINVKNARICSAHFVQGQPAALEDETHPDWVPTLNLGHGLKRKADPTQASGRYARRIARARGQEAGAGPGGDESEPVSCFTSLASSLKLDSS